jgi:PKD repeat protein
MKFYSLLGIVLFASVSFAQNNTHTHKGPENPEFCGVNHQMETLYEQNPSFKTQDSIEQSQFQIDYESFMEEWSPGERVAYIIPIVIHVVHLGGPENISNSQIYDGIEKLNDDFNMANSDLGNTVASFQGVIGDADIEFRLATKDPNGNCHSGITRTYSSTTYDTGLSFETGTHPIVDAVAAQHGTWQQKNYLNVFICIDPSGAAGYTFNPGGWLPPSTMYGGIMLRHDYMGTNGTGGSNARHTLSHEVGHWLNLSHCWGGTNDPGVASSCSSDDGVNDTPNTIGWTSCNTSGSTCSSLDNVQNIMEYSYCSTMFTQGQIGRMDNALNSGTGGRNNLWIAGNLSATGTNVPNVTICEVDFSNTNTVICAGSTVDFSDLSFFGVTNRTWSFDGGTPSASSDSSLTIVYNTPGIYDVSLQISDGSNSLSETSTNLITVLPNPGVALPYTEGFENITFPDNYNFFVENQDEGNTWAITSSAASTGSKSIKMNNYNVTGGTVDAFVSGPIDMSVLDASENLLLTFKYAYKKRNEADDEWLRVYVSKDCGENWSLRKNYHGTNLNSAVSASAFTPSSEDDWTSVSIDNITSSYYVSNFRYKIQFDGEGGNNIYVDDINLYPQSWLENPENNIENTISVYPNPTNNKSTVEYFSTSNNDINIELFNILGKKVSTVYSGAVSIGNNKFEINMENFPKGIYIVKVSDESGMHTIKLIKE